MIQIGRLELDLQARELRLGGSRARIGTRAFDILVVLVNARGTLVTKEEIFRKVWADTIVEENNLQVHMSALRKALGEDRDLIITVPGRGYRFVGLERDGAPPHDPTFGASRRGLVHADHNLPTHHSTLFGRQSAIEEIHTLLSSTPVMTLAGAGGIGKTRLGIEVARQQLAAGADEVRLVELATVSDPCDVPAAIAAACGLGFLADGVTPERLAGALTGHRALLLLDDCEHLVCAVARLVELLVRRNPALRVLVTSREPLRIANEQRYDVAGLDVPPPGASATQSVNCAAVQLFLSRIRAIEPHLATDARTVERIGELCRRLDGIPLSIELAAARAATLGIGILLNQLDDRLDLLNGGHRTALARHQSLRASFDWSYATLDSACQAVFRRLGIFTGHFTLEAACAVVCADGADKAGTTDHISTLVEKSLLTRRLDGPTTEFRLLESTRAYALERLDREGERARLALAHATYLLAQLEAVQAAPRDIVFGDSHSEPADTTAAGNAGKVVSLRRG